MSNLDAVFKLLANNTGDVEQVIRQFGGIGNVIRAAPALLRIMNTISSAKDPVEEAERVDKGLLYSEETKDKVAAFQKAHGLHVDGLIGDRTWRKVEELLAEKKA